jgi:hypothetical protein
MKPATRTARFVVLASLVTSLAMSACAPRQSGTSGADGEQTLNLPGSLVLMPVGDARDDRFEDVELSRYVRDAAIRVLGRKGYAAMPRDEIEKEGLSALRKPDDMTASELAALAPPGAEALVFLSVTRVRREYGYGGPQYDVTLSGTIVSPSTQTIIWRGTGSGRTSLGGFLRMLSPSSPAYDAIYEALQHLFRDVPKRPK